MLRTFFQFRSQFPSNRAVKQEPEATKITQQQIQIYNNPHNLMMIFHQDIHGLSETLLHLQQNIKMSSLCTFNGVLISLNKIIQMKESKQQNQNDQKVKMISELKSITESLCPKYRRIICRSQLLRQEGLNDRQQQQKENALNKMGLVSFKDNATNSPANRGELIPGNQCKLTSVLRINRQIKLPTLQDKKRSFGSQNMRQDQAVLTQLALESPGLSLKSRNKINPKIRSRQTQMSQQQVRQQIKDCHGQLNHMIEKTSIFFQQRLKTHQNQLMKVMMSQVKRVNQQSLKTIMKYNQLIRKQKSGIQLHITREQTNYYKKQVIQMARHNEQLKKQIKYLKKLNSQYEMKMQIDSETLRRMGRKLLIQKQRNCRIVKSFVESVATKNVQTPKLSSPGNLGIEKLKQLSIQQKIGINTLDLTQCTGLDCLKSISEDKMPLILLNGLGRQKDNRQKYKHQNSSMSIKNNKLSPQRQCLHHSLKQVSFSKLQKQLSSEYKMKQDAQKLYSQHRQMIQEQRTKQANYLRDKKYNGITEIKKDEIVCIQKQTRPSIKAIIQHRKVQNKSSLNKIKNQLVSQRYYDKIKIIKNRVRMSSFDPQMSSFDPQMSSFDPQMSSFDRQLWHQLKIDRI